MTLISGYLCLTSFVAARPSMTGIRTSMRIRSGLKREHSKSACRPLAASPTISMSGSSESMFWRLSLVSSWSSTIAKRVGPPTYSGEISVPTSLLTFFDDEEASESVTALGAAADSVSYLYDLEAGPRRNLDVVSREDDRVLRRFTDVRLMYRVAWAY